MFRGSMEAYKCDLWPVQRLRQDPKDECWASPSSGARSRSKEAPRLSCQQKANHWPGKEQEVTPTSLTDALVLQRWQTGEREREEGGLDLSAAVPVWTGSRWEPGKSRRTSGLTQQVTDGDSASLLVPWRAWLSLAERAKRLAATELGATGVTGDVGRLADPGRYSQSY